MFHTIKAGLAFAAPTGAFLLSPSVGAQDNMKPDSLKQAVAVYCERFHAVFGVAKREKF